MIPIRKSHKPRAGDKFSLSISGLAKAAGVGIETIRFYHRKGLLGRPPKGSTGYRRYTQEEINRVLFIKKAQSLGFSLKEISQLISMTGSVGGTCAHTKAVFETKLVEIREQVETLRQVEEAVLSIVGRCRNEHGCQEKPCKILQSLKITEPLEPGEEGETGNG